MPEFPNVTELAVPLFIAAMLLELAVAMRWRRARYEPRDTLASLATFNPLRIASHEWLQMARDVAQPELSLRQRLAYLFGPPGWSHGGSLRTAAGIKAEHRRRHIERRDGSGQRASGER